MEYYTLKEIILGLRNEYKQNEKLLEGLKDYVGINPCKGLKEFEFYQYNQGRDKYIQLYIKERNNFIIEFLQNLTNSIPDKTYEVAHEYNGERRYVVLPQTNIYELFEKSQNRFYMKIDEILGNNFSQNIATGTIDAGNAKLTIKPSAIDTYIKPGDINIPTSGVVYYSKLDQVIITAYEDALYKEQFDHLFRLRIPKDSLNEEQRKTIDNNPNKNKRLLITGSNSSRAGQYYKFDDADEETVVLRRVK